jgi:hypothetical protein
MSGGGEEELRMGENEEEDSERQDQEPEEPEQEQEVAAGPGIQAVPLQSVKKQMQQWRQMNTKINSYLDNQTGADARYSQTKAFQKRPIQPLSGKQELKQLQLTRPKFLHKKPKSKPANRRIIHRVTKVPTKKATLQTFSPALAPPPPTPSET